MSQENRARQRPPIVNRGLARIAPLSLCIVAVLAFTASVIYAGVIEVFPFTSGHCRSPVAPHDEVFWCEGKCCRVLFINDKTGNAGVNYACCPSDVGTHCASDGPDEEGVYHAKCVFWSGGGGGPCEGCDDLGEPDNGETNP